MQIEIGHVEAIYRYPVKSMRGEGLEFATLGWHGLDGDRRLAFRRMDDRSGFPWLTASKLPDLLLFDPRGDEDGDPGDPATHVRTPDGARMPIFGDDLAAEVGRRHGAPVQMTRLNHGIFDEASISVITSDTAREIGRLAGRSADVRRFRPNIVVRSRRPVPFEENEWVGCVLSFGGGDEDPAITVTMRDARCSMVNLDPDSASSAPEVLKAVVRANQNNAGIYGTVTRRGGLAVGQRIFLRGAMAATLLGVSACSSRTPMDQTKLTDLASRYAAAWSSQIPDSLASFYSANGSLTVNAGPPSVGRPAIAATARSYMSAFPDMVVRMDSVSPAGSHAVFHWTWTGTNTGPGGTGKAVRLSGYEEWTIGPDGLITESKGHFDEAEYQRQLKSGPPATP